MAVQRRRACAGPFLPVGGVGGGSRGFLAGRPVAGEGAGAPGAPGLGGAARGRLAVVCMGRRAAKIAARKGKSDALKTKLYGKIGKRVFQAVREGGPDPKANYNLQRAIDEAKASSVPKEIVDRNIKRASDPKAADLQQNTYEAYGADGVGFLIESETDNANRAFAAIREAVVKGGGKMAEAGSVAFNFERRGVLRLGVPEGGPDVDEDALFEAVIEAGGDDLKPPNDEDDFFTILTSLSACSAVQEALREAGFPVDGGLEPIPLALVEATDEGADVNATIEEKLLDLDDVDTVTHNQAP